LLRDFCTKLPVFAHLDVSVAYGQLLMLFLWSPYDSRGLCGGVLGRNDTLLGVPAGLQGQVERALERWACRIVDERTVALWDLDR
jgi:hypothetical protein